MLEKVQMKAVKQVVGLRGTTYRDRCRELNLDTLKDRREMADLIQVWKIIHKVDKVDADRFFEYASNRAGTSTRSTTDPLNLKGKASRLDLRKYSFSVRTVDLWNKLDSQTKCLPTAWKFKNAIKHLYRSRVEGATVD